MTRCYGFTAAVWGAWRMRNSSSAYSIVDSFLQSAAPSPVAGLCRCTSSHYWHKAWLFVLLEEHLFKGQDYPCEAPTRPSGLRTSMASRQRRIAVLCQAQRGPGQCGEVKDLGSKPLRAPLVLSLPCASEQESTISARNVASIRSNSVDKCPSRADVVTKKRGRCERHVRRSLAVSPGGMRSYLSKLLR